VAQPLLASDVDFGGGVVKDVLIVATMHGTVYGLGWDGDPEVGQPRRRRSETVTHFSVPTAPCPPGVACRQRCQLETSVAVDLNG
jgi:hypothetical protein